MGRWWKSWPTLPTIWRKGVDGGLTPVPECGSVNTVPTGDIPQRVTPPSRRQGLHVEVLRAGDRLRPLRSSWRALAGELPFRDWSWLEPWAEIYVPAGELFVLVAREGDGSVVGLVPWHLDRGAAGRVLRWLGVGEVYSDHPGILCREGYEERVARATAAALTVELEPHWDLLDLATVPVKDRTVGWLREALRGEGCVELRRPHPEMGWRIPLPERWEDFLAGLSRSHRKQLRRLVRAFDRSPTMTHRRVESPEDLARVWPTVVDLHQRRRAALGDRGAFDSPLFGPFLLRASGILLEEGRLGLHWLESEGRIIAIDHQVIDGPVVYSYLVGMSPEHRALRPGALLTALTIRSAIEEGFTGYDLLRGNQPYKAHWGAKPRKYTRVMVANRRARARVALEATRSMDVLMGALRAVKRRLIPPSKGQVDPMRRVG